MTNLDKVVSWSQLQNWFPIVSASLLVSTAFWTNAVRLSLVENKIDQLVKNQEEILGRYARLEDRDDALAIKISILETEHRRR